MPTNNKHAYLIIAHGNLFVLEKLILLLDDECNDIFIHIDKKLKEFDFTYFQNLPKYSLLFFTDRIDVRWGHTSLVKCELTLFKKAISVNQYAYYHLISGSDLPIKSQDEVHDFFYRNAGKEFLGFSDDDFDSDRVTKYYLFPKNMRVQEHEYLSRLRRKTRNLFLSLQRAIAYNRDVAVWGEVKFGTQWASLTHNFVKQLVENEKYFLDVYRYTNCSDEIYKQTFAFNSPFRDSIYCFDDELKGCQRFMDWQRGRPYTFRKEDFQQLMNSEKMFARKFEDVVDKDIVQKIFDCIKAQ